MKKTNDWVGFFKRRLSLLEIYCRKVQLCEVVMATDSEQEREIIVEKLLRTFINRQEQS